MFSGRDGAAAFPTLRLLLCRLRATIQKKDKIARSRLLRSEATAPARSRLAAQFREAEPEGNERTRCKRARIEASGATVRTVAPLGRPIRIGRPSGGGQTGLAAA